MSNFISVIMAGGSGQRFWPLSTPEKPKQFLDLEGTGSSLLQATFERLRPLVEKDEHIFVVTGERYNDLICEQLPNLPCENIILEPVGRDTAPAVALTALHLKERFGNALMGLFTSDHRVGKVEAFQQTVREAIDLTNKTNGLTTIGIKPNYPSTGFGYIQAGEQVGSEAYKVARFVEKPSEAIAEQYLADGGYYWNNGIFLWHVATILDEFAKYTPNMISQLQNAFTEGKIAEVFPKVEKISIDYAVLEKTDKAYVVPADYDWDDLGDWVALERLQKDDALSGPNTVVGKHIDLDAFGNIIFTTHDDDVIVTLGVKNLVVVKRGHTVLLVDKSRTQDIKKLLKDERLENVVFEK